MTDGAHALSSLPATTALAAQTAMSRTSPLSQLRIEFIGSFPDPRVRLEPPLPEIAFLGRSNVGKSSLLNALVGRRGLARVSTTPGKTTLLNVFRLPELYLIDLPGYGYARASQSQRAGYRRLIRGVLEKRVTLSGIVWLLDIRHPPSKDDREFGTLLAERGLPVLVALTKADKLSRTRQRERACELAAALRLPEQQFLLTSATTGVGIAELAENLLGALATEER
jgi:GTP-binding protein